MTISPVLSAPFTQFLLEMGSPVYSVPGEDGQRTLVVGKKMEVGNGAAEMGTGLAPTAGYPNPGKTPAV